MYFKTSFILSIVPSQQKFKPYNFFCYKIEIEKISPFLVFNLLSRWDFEIAIGLFYTTFPRKPVINYFPCAIASKIFIADRYNFSSPTFIKISNWQCPVSD